MPFLLASIVWDGHSCLSPLTLILTFAVILRRRSRARSGRLPTKDLCNSLAAEGPVQFAYAPEHHHLGP